MDNYHILGYPVIGYKENKDDDDDDEPNAAFFVALLAKEHRTYTSFKSQTVLTTHHLLSQINQHTRQETKRHGSKYKTHVTRPMVQSITDTRS